MKKILIVTTIALLAIGLNVIPAHAYSVLTATTGGAACSVYITASGQIAGNTVAFSVSVVPQGGGAATALTFSNPSGIMDSGKALKIVGGTNMVNSRIILYTDNASYFTKGHDPRYEDGDPTMLPTGADGSGMVGASDTGYVVSMFWGTQNGTSAGATPSDNVNYSFGYTVDGSGNISFTNATWIVDKGNSYKYVTINSTLDNATLYKGTTTSSVAVENKDGDGLMPQSWTEDYWTSATVHIISNGSDNTLAGMALYKSIATTAFSLGYDGTNYNCVVPDLTAACAGDFTKNVPGNLTSGIYIYIGADFRNKPAQNYTTSKLYIEEVQD
ncbi:MAG: hypothetical protein WC522_03280 [Candidatus Omnitrophota bacterium]